jgi:hypothetical protein
MEAALDSEGRRAKSRKQKAESLKKGKRRTVNGERYDFI